MQKSKKILIKSKKKPAKLFIYGIHAVDAALNNSNRVKSNLYISDKFFNTYSKYSNIVTIKVIESYDFRKFLPENAIHQEIALEVSNLNETNLQNILEKAKSKSLIVILDQVSDPQNIGAIIRSATAFGADAVINTINNSPNETPIIAKAACGGLDITPYIRVTNISRTIQLLKDNNYWCFGLDGHTNESFPIEFPEKTCIILGSEDSGIRKLVKENCDALYKINMSSKMESLNVSVAAAIVMNKFYK